MKKLHPMPSHCERALAAYDKVVRRVQKTLARRADKMTFTQIMGILAKLDDPARTLVREVRQARVPGIERLPTAPMQAAAELWRLRFQPQDL